MTTSTRVCPPAPPSTPFPEDTSEYYGWFSEAAQQLRVSYPTVHMHMRTKQIMMSPPYTYWMQGDKKVLVTEVTHTSIPTQRQVANGDICVGRVDRYVGREYVRSERNYRNQIMI